MSLVTSCGAACKQQLVVMLAALPAQNGDEHGVSVDELELPLTVGLAFAPVQSESTVFADDAP